MLFSKSSRFCGNYTLEEIQRRLAGSPLDVVQVRISNRMYNLVAPKSLINLLGECGQATMIERKRYNAKAHIKALTQGRMYDPSEPETTYVRYSVLTEINHARLETLEAML